MVFYVYILLCRDGTFYTGYTKDLRNRVKRHMRNPDSKYIKGHRPEKLVYTEEFDSRKEAMRRERKIKSLSHEAKRKLIGLSIVE